LRALLKTAGPDPAGGQTVAFANNNNPATSINDVPVVNDDLGKIAARLWGRARPASDPASGT
jgi:hypothetical protein